MGQRALEQPRSPDKAWCASSADGHGLTWQAQASLERFDFDSVLLPYSESDAKPQIPPNLRL